MKKIRYYVAGGAVRGVSLSEHDDMELRAFLEEQWFGSLVESFVVDFDDVLPDNRFEARIACAVEDYLARERAAGRRIPFVSI